MKTAVLSASDVHVHVSEVPRLQFWCTGSRTTRALLQQCVHQVDIDQCKSNVGLHTAELPGCSVAIHPWPQLQVYTSCQVMGRSEIEVYVVQGIKHVSDVSCLKAIDLSDHFARSAIAFCPHALDQHDLIVRSLSGASHPDFRATSMFYRASLTLKCLYMVYYLII